MTENECAAIIILVAMVIQFLVITIAFFCEQRERKYEQYQNLKPLYPPPLSDGKRFR